MQLRVTPTAPMYGQQGEPTGDLAAFVRTAGRALFPAIALLAVTIAGYLYRHDPLLLADDVFPGTSEWLPLGALAIPASFFVVHLANRCYGPAVALTQLAAAWIAVAVLALGPAIGADWEIPGLMDVSPRVAFALSASLAFAQVVAIIAFDKTRSWRWWTGPFHGSFWASLIFSLTFFPAACFGADFAWLSHMAAFFAISLAASVVLLVVYWIARPFAWPVPGLVGY